MLKIFVILLSIVGSVKGARFREFGNYYHSNPNISSTYFVLDVTDVTLSQPDFKYGIQTIKLLHEWLSKRTTSTCIVISNHKYGYFQKVCDQKLENVNYLNDLMDLDFDRIYGPYSGKDKIIDKYTVVEKNVSDSLPNDIVVLLISDSTKESGTPLRIAEAFDRKKIKVLEFKVNEVRSPKNFQYLGTQFYKSYLALYEYILRVYNFHAGIKVVQP